MFYILYRLLSSVVLLDVAGLWGRAVRYNGTEDYSERFSQDC